jgi:AraC family transcriptional regulator, regulatory protein of adaptative response / methylated-DNA-[protein]-cysteine methyltransferase
MNRLQTPPDMEASEYASDEQRWTATVTRDTAADGHFYYAVTTTGIYCKPSCPSRRARRGNVRFYDTSAAARQDGFRPCKRCLPDQANIPDRHAQAIAKACRCIEQAETCPDIAELAESTGMSRFHFQRVFKAMTGLTPRAYAEATRKPRLRTALEQSASVTDAIYAAGFNSSGRFYESVHGLLGMTPTAYRAGGAGLTIRFALGECWLGTILVAATERGVCSISLGDDADTLLRELEDRFPRAQLRGAEPDFERWVAQVVGFVQQPSLGLDLPLDIQGTAFQQRVWQALRDIPAGSTASYTQIAERIGHPTAVRAVARACASNPLAVAIPCHRVVRTDGTLSGYRWGVERKRALLEREASE